ncbi:hypothetical protein GTA08_BOTSDO10291 [Botryosphaeria dothidea]|uniref:Uncharacterized protein n=1 Tax=Botryosphaeria dothidea TaxID=55169 RepID=A0A8H4IJX5_9PEZI|nr:hypothetical protein GTA08_BOTSDO10291 [Botryosphaeria dothidea]
MHSKASDNGMLGHGLGEASSNIVPGARSTTIAPDDKWDKFPREQENMKDLWETISAAVTQKDIAILEASELKNFNSIPRKEIGVKARHFSGLWNGIRIEAGTWLVGFPMMTPGDKTWRARVDVLYDIAGPILTVQEYVQEIKDWTRRSFFREAAEKSKTDTSGDTAIRPVESTVVSRQGLRKRRRRAVQDSGDGDEQPSRDASGGQSSSQEQLECALDTIKKLQALLREQGDEITELKLRLTTEQ